MTILMQLKTRSQCKTSYQNHLRGLLDPIIVAFGKRTAFATTHFLHITKQAHILQKRNLILKII